MKFIFKQFKRIFKDKLVKTLTKNASSLLSGTVISHILGLITLALTTRLLGKELFGTFILIQTYVIITDLIFNTQTWHAVIKYGAEYLEAKNIKGFKSIIKYGSLIDVLTAILAIIIGMFLIPLISPIINIPSDYESLLYIYMIVVVFNLTATPIAILRLFDKFKLFSYQLILTSLIKLIGIVIATITNTGITGVVVTWVITEIIGYITLFALAHIILYKNNINRWWLVSEKRNFIKVFKFSFWTNLTSILDLPIKQLDMIIVSIVVSVEGVGVYKIIKQVSQVITKIGDAVFQAIYPQLTKLIANKEYKTSLKFSFKGGLLILTVILPITIVVSSTSYIWLDLIFGNSYQSYWLALSLYFFLRTISLMFICIHPLFIALGLVRKNVSILLIANTIYLLLSYILGSNFNLYGVIIAYGFQFSLVLIMKLTIIKKQINNNKIGELYG